MTPLLLQFIHGLDHSKTSSTQVYGLMTVAQMKPVYCRSMIKCGCLPKLKLTVRVVKNTEYVVNSILLTLYSMAMGR
jgi:hypothetical protein